MAAPYASLAITLGSRGCHPGLGASGEVILRQPFEPTTVSHAKMIDEHTTLLEATSALIAIGGFAAARGWVPATSGNFSRRLDANTILITRSGVDKGTLTPGDFIAVQLDAPIPPGVSAETPLHVARYRADATIAAILHVHTLAATLLSRLERERGELTFDGYEMQKALSGFSTHASVVHLPIFANEQDTSALAARIEARLAPSAGVPGYLLAGHGLYTWGTSMLEAQRHLEGLEFLLACALEERRPR